MENEILRDYIDYIINELTTNISGSINETIIKTNKMNKIFTARDQFTGGYISFNDCMYLISKVMYNNI